LEGVWAADRCEKGGEKAGSLPVKKRGPAFRNQVQTLRGQTRGGRTGPGGGGGQGGVSGGGQEGLRRFRAHLGTFGNLDPGSAQVPRQIGEKGWQKGPGGVFSTGNTRTRFKYIDQNTWGREDGTGGGVRNRERWGGKISWQILCFSTDCCKKQEGKKVMKHGTEGLDKWTPSIKIRKENKGRRRKTWR